MPGAGKPSDKPQPSAGRKNGDTTRKQSDGGQRRTPAPRAWQSGMNPITNRSNNASQQNGSNTSTVKPGAKPGMSQESAGLDKAAHDRLLYLFANLLGQNATLTIKTGDVFSGLFWGATAAENQSVSYQLKMVQQTRHGERANTVNGARDTSKDFIGAGDDYSMTFENKDVVGLSVEGIDFLTSERQVNGASGFRTDTDISGNLAIRERELQRWTASSDDAPGFSLEDTNGGGADWDQFKANERLFGLKSDYDENFYTTSLDRSSAQYRQQEAKAQRIAREIESSVSNSAHTREERGLADDDGDLDEEEKYSGVRRPAADYPPLRSTQPNRYMPPARRPPSGQPSVPGAPVDPAIISSQMARPDISPKRSVDQPSAKPDATTAAPPSTEPLQSEAKAEASKDQLPVKAPNATANVETEVLDSFRTFAEKQKTKVADDRQKRVRHEKDIKLNDLKGFSRTFKLHTPVPNDLVPILAKDKKKQDEIMEKARREVEEHAKSPSKTARVVEEAPARPPSDRREGGKVGTAPSERQDLSSYRQQQFPPRGPQASMNRDRSHPHANTPSGNPGLLSHRLNETQRAHKAGTPVAIPTPLPLHNGQKPPSRPSGTYVPGSQPSSTVRTPTSANSSRFNVQASEFKPNPAASSFKQSQPVNAAAASPRPKATNRRTSPAASINDFFGGKKMLSAAERPNILEHFNPLKRLKEKAEKEGKSKDYSANGGIIYAHATPVTWSVLKDDEPETSYKDMFDDIAHNAAPGVSPQRGTSSPMNPAQAHIHQVPPHMHHANISHSPSPNPSSFGGPHQPHMFVQSGAPHAYDDPRMHGSPSASAYSTPRMPGNFISYPTTMGPGMQFPYAQQGPHMVAPGGPQPLNFRQFSNGHQYMPSPGQQMAAPMMVSQSSSGGYMGSPAVGVPHVPMYPAGPAAGYGGPAQPSSGYPSPGRSAPMMMHQGSYQGQSPAMHPAGPQYGQPYFAQGQVPHMNPMRGYPSPQPHFGHSPQQQYHYPPQPTRMPSHGYGAHPPSGSSGVPAQPAPAAAGGIEGGEGPK